MTCSLANFSVLIVILNYQTYQLTLELIESIRKTIVYPCFDIMVVDNCSPNESGTPLARRKAELGFELIVNDVNSGYAAGNNIGIKYAIQKGYRYTWILNNDIVLKSNSTLMAMVEIMKSDSSVAAVSPKILNPDGLECYQYYYRPSLWDMSFGIAGSKKKRENVDSKRSQKIYRPHGCCMLLRNSSMEVVECLDERTFLYGEEEILAERLLKKNLHCWYCADSEVIHMESATVNSVQKKRRKIKQVFLSQKLYLKEYRKFPLLARLLCKVTRGAIILLRG